MYQEPLINGHDLSLNTKKRKSQITKIEIIHTVGRVLNNTTSVSNWFMTPTSFVVYFLLLILFSFQVNKFRNTRGFTWNCMYLYPLSRLMLSLKHLLLIIIALAIKFKFSYLSSDDENLKIYFHHTFKNSFD